MTDVAACSPDPEVLVRLDMQEATRLDKRLRLMAGTARENFEKVGRLLDEAKRGRVHEVLGFKSWTEYVAEAVGGQLQLSGDSRAAMVQMLAGEGMSVRAIATATGVSKSTVDRDLARVSHDGTPDTDGMADSAVPQRYTALADAVSSVRDWPSNEPKVTGLDGKTYTKPKRKPPRAKKEHTPRPEPVVSERRVQIPTAFREKLNELKPLVADLAKLTQDQRWIKAVDRFNHKDRVTLDAHIAALQEFRVAMGYPYNGGTPSSQESVAT